MTDWQTLNSKVVYENKFLSVHEDLVVHPNGTHTLYYVIDRGPFSIIVPLTPTNETYLVGQYRYAIKKYSWEFPMGSVKGKGYLDMAKQELKEETGLTATSWVRVGKFAVAAGHANQITEVFLAKDLTSGKAEPEENEVLEAKKVALADIPSLIKSGEIIDGVTISAYYLLTLYLDEHSKSSLSSST